MAAVALFGMVLALVVCLCWCVHIPQKLLGRWNDKVAIPVDAWSQSHDSSESWMESLFMFAEALRCAWILKLFMNLFMTYCILKKYSMYHLSHWVSCCYTQKTALASWFNTEVESSRRLLKPPCKTIHSSPHTRPVTAIFVANTIWKPCL